MGGITKMALFEVSLFTKMGRVNNPLQGDSRAARRES
jgi:hypothetical protein